MFSPDWNNIVYDGRNDLVFEGKNKEYGAYMLRKSYKRTINIALSITLGIVVVLIAIPKIMDLISGLVPEEEITTEVTIDLTKPPPVDPTEPPPPPPPPPPVMETTKFTPPKVVDEQVEEQPPIQEKLPETTVSTVTQEGDDGELQPIVENKVIEDNNVYDRTAIEEQPGFPGGEGALMGFLKSNIKYPAIEKDNDIQGKVYVTFVIEKDGSVNDVQIMKGIAGGPNCDKEALRVVKSMPKWAPGKQNGKAVRCKFILPVTFKLS